VNVSILISSFGDEKWKDLAWSRAYPSAVEQDAHEVLVNHEPEGTLASCRNNNAERTTGDFLCHLDADDELAPGYVTAMETVISHIDEVLDPLDCLYTPRVQYEIYGKYQPPKFWPEIPLSTGSWLVIGTLVPRALFWEVGGFEEWAAYEDWQLFAKCWKAGAQIVKVPDAVYLAHWTPDSRNKSLPRQELLRIQYEIGRELFPEEYGEAWLHQHLRSATVKRRQRARAR
jgi:hypothetical protein